MEDVCKYFVNGKSSKYDGLVLFKLDVYVPHISHFCEDKLNGGWCDFQV